MELYLARVLAENTNSKTVWSPGKKGNHRISCDCWISAPLHLCWRQIWRLIAFSLYYAQAHVQLHRATMLFVQHSSLHRPRTVHCVDYFFFLEKREDPRFVYLHYSTKFPSNLWITRLLHLSDVQLLLPTVQIVIMKLHSAERMVRRNDSLSMRSIRWPWNNPICIAIFISSRFLLKSSSHVNSF